MTADDARARDNVNHMAKTPNERAIEACLEVDHHIDFYLCGTDLVGIDFGGITVNRMIMTIEEAEKFHEGLTEAICIAKLARKSGTN